MINISIGFIYFIIYGFIGWFFETLYCSALENKFVNRVFLNGPICPVYGVAALLLIYFLEPLKTNPLTLYITAMVLASMLEYITGLLLEILFNMKWWDYSDKKFNINGRVCLENTLLFGGMSLILMYGLHPIFGGFINKLSGIAHSIISSSLLLLFITDMTISIITVLKLNGKLSQLAFLIEQIETKERDLKERIYAALKLEENNQINRLKEHIEKLKERYNFAEVKINVLQRRILKAFPKLHSNQYDELLSDIRNKFKKSERK